MWRVYYEDGSTWNWTEGLEGIPTYGVMCILQQIQADHGLVYHIVYGCQYYMRSQGEWLHARENDLIDFLQHQIPIDTVLVGRMTTKKRFAEVYQAAKNDKDAENL